MKTGLIYAAGWAGLAIVGILALSQVKPGPEAAAPAAKPSVAADLSAFAGDASRSESAVSGQSASASVASSASVSVAAVSSSSVSASSASSSSASSVAVVATTPEAPLKPLNRAGRRCQDRVTAIIARKGVQYGFDSYELTPQGRRTIRDVYRVLTSCPTPVRLTITGYTDNVGSDAQNKLVSAGRAVAAMNALTALGWPDSKVSARGLGSADPIATNKTFAGRNKNRRVVFTLNSAR